MNPIQRNILLNPGPGTTSDSVKYAQVVPDICPREKEFGDLVESLVGDLTQIAGGSEDDVSVLFGGSGTAAMEATVSSTVPDGGKILVVVNGAYGERMVEIARIYGIDVTALELDPTRPVDPDRVEAALAADSELCGLFAVHHETTSGVLNPVAEMGRLAAKYDCFFAVDAISSYAGIPFDIQECGINFTMSVSNKCLQGMPGVAFVVCRRPALERIKEYRRRSLYLSLYDQFEYFERHRQTRFTPPVQTLYALRRAVDEFEAEGASARYQRYSENWRTLRRGMEELGFRALTSPEQDSRILTTFHYPELAGFDFDRMHDELFARGYTVYPGKLAGPGTFRVANLGEIHPADIEDFLRELAAVIQPMRQNGSGS